MTMGSALMNSAYISTAGQIADGIITPAKLSFTPAGSAGHVMLGRLTATVVQGTWANSINSLYHNCSIWNNTTTRALNDEITYKACLDVGTYTLFLIATTDSDGAILTLGLDGTSVGTVDLYSAGTTRNVTKTITGIAVATAGLYTISFKAASKNPASSNYAICVSEAVFFRTA